MSPRRLSVLLVLAAALVVLAVRVMPLSLAGVRPSARDAFRYLGPDGRSHVYLGDLDSYLWLRHARNYLRTGTTCDAIVGGECRDTLGSAPVGQPMRYARSLHIAAIAGLHRAVTVIAPEYPLAATAYWVPVVVGVLGVVPAFAIGSRLAGPIGGFAGALAIGTNWLFLRRSIGSDNDVWNVVLPLFAAWAAIAAVRAARPAHRAALTAVAALVVGLHAATWAGWLLTFAVLLVGLVADAMLAVLEAAARRRAGPCIRDAALILAVFCAVSGIAVAAAGAGGVRVALPEALVAPLVGAAPSAPVSEVAWPDVFGTIRELAQPGPGGIVRVLGSPAYLLTACLGLALLLLPERGWRAWHWVVFIGGLDLCLYAAAAAPHWSPVAVVVLLGMPLVAGAVLRVLVARGEQGDRGQLVVGVWFLATLLQAYEGVRFLMLLVPPAGLLLGVALGRLYASLVRAAVPRAGRYAAVLRPVLFVAVAALALPAVRRGAAEARAYVPAMHDAWWNTLTAIRDGTPPDTIVNAWWDYGHWVKYVAERRVSTDGGTLRTHVPHWLARALLAPSERETAGLLRMLNCGSDVTADGAYGRLVAAGIDPIVAYRTVVAAAGLDRDAARALLAARGLGAETADAVLRATHCTPPPARLVLTSAMVGTDWRRIGAWDPLRAWIAAAARERAAADVAAELVGRFGLAEEDARRLAVRAAALETPSERDRFVAPTLDYRVAEWVPCTAVDAEWICPLPPGTIADGAVVDQVVYRPDAPAATRVRMPARGTAAARTVRPASVLVASARGLAETSVADASVATLGVLVDAVESRALLGHPEVLRSTFTHLVFLDGRYAERFEKVDDRSGYGGERVVTWAIRGGGDPGLASAGDR
jgi:asparagine N-glycosylation enzyme membrane subunit Stt3